MKKESAILGEPLCESQRTLFAAHHFLLVMIAFEAFLAVRHLLAADLVGLWTDYRRPTLVLAGGIAIGLAG